MLDLECFCFPLTNSSSSEVVRSRSLEQAASLGSPTRFVELNTTSVSCTRYTADGEDKVLHKFSITLERLFFREPVIYIHFFNVMKCSQVQLHNYEIWHFSTFNTIKIFYSINTCIFIILQFSYYCKCLYLSKPKNFHMYTILSFPEHMVFKITFLSYFY